VTLHSNNSYIKGNLHILLQTHREFQDFYNMSHQAGQVIKFTVVDLHASQNSAGKPLGFPSLDRNPFDGDPFEFAGKGFRPFL
jgi:hypothetical protein